MAKTKIHCCDGTEINVSEMPVEEVVAMLKELNEEKGCPCVLQSEHRAGITVLELRAGEGDFRVIQSSDVGRLHIKAFGRTWPVSDFMGRITPTDVGKRIYLAAPDVLQVESRSQFEGRERRSGRMFR